MKRTFVCSSSSFITIVVLALVFGVIPATTTENEDYNKAFKDNYVLYSPPIPDSLCFAGEEVFGCILCTGSFG